MSTLTDRAGSWTAQAACGSGATGPLDPDAMFVQGAAQREARQVCFACPVRLECLVEAFENGLEFGVWGGLTERERRAMARGSAVASSGQITWRTRLEYDADLRARFEEERLRASRAG